MDIILPMRLTLSLLGNFRLTLDGTAVAQFRSDKERALLALLVLDKERPHRRETLAGLFWGDQPQALAFNNLRKTIHRLRHTLQDESQPTPFLLVNTKEVQWNPTADAQVDVWEFTAALNQSRHHAHRHATSCVICQGWLETAAALYQRNLLEGFALDDSPAFDEWLAARRELLRMQALTALNRLIAHYEWVGAPEQALTTAQHLLTLEPWQESAHRALMRLLAASGERGAALRQYEQCKALLTAELGIAPERETTALYETLKAGEPIATPRPRPLALPTAVTPFIGRQTELAELRQKLLHPDTRLLTLVGEGGIGKTRLAVAVATQVQHDFPDGLWFVDLTNLDDETEATAGVSLPLRLVMAIAQALGLVFSGSQPPHNQLLAMLKNWAGLLVLDNFETVLTAAHVVADLLQAVPHVVVVATSREPLNLHGESLYAVGGLALAGEATAADALDFFTQCAQRIHPPFVLAEELADVVTLCQLTRGMPLALELAASWVKTLSVAEIVAEIQRDLDILQAQQANRPARHRSIQAVLNQTWQRLTPAEQDIFARLAIFQGPFNRSAAQQVAGATLTTLTHLLNKALLQRRQPTHYTMHPLVRQFGYGWLQANPAIFQATQSAYANTMADFCHGRLLQLLRHDLQTLAELKQEQDNIRAVWKWAAANHEVAILGKMAQPLKLYLAHYSHNQELYQQFETAVQALSASADPTAPPALAYALLELGHAHMILGRLADADQTLQASETLYAQLNLPYAVGLGTDPATIRSIVAWMRSDFGAAVQLGQKALGQARTQQNPHNEAYAHFVLSGAHIALGDYGTAKSHAQQAFAVAQTLHNPTFLGYCHMELGKSALALGDFTAADTHFETAFALPQKMGNLTGMAMARLMLGESQRRQQKWAGAAVAFDEARQIYTDIHNRMGLARAYAGLGDAATGQGELAQARAWYRQGLDLVVAAGLQTYANTVLVGVGEWLRAVGLDERAGVVLTAVAQDPHVNVELKERALRLLAAVALPAPMPAPHAFQLAATLAEELEQVALPPTPVPRP